MNTYRDKTRQQVQDLMARLTVDAMQKVDQALTSGAVPDSWRKDDNYLLAKAVVDSVCRDRPYKALTDEYQADFDNLHLFL